MEPTAEDSWNNLGSLVNTQGRDQEATEYYHKSLEVNPLAPQTYYNFGTVLQEQGKQLFKAKMLRGAQTLWLRLWTEVLFPNPKPFLN